MRESFLLSALIVFVFISTASADQISVSFCIDADMDDWCDEEFTALVERDGMTDMDLLEIAFEEELMIYDWDEYLWAVAVEGDDYDYLPQFDGASDVYLEDGYEVYIWFTGWRWYSPGTGPTMPGSQENPQGSESGSWTGGDIPGPSIPGSAEVTAVPTWLKG